tara:strand:- start:1502 stop:2659 length:1158 start_codon:yes stop_codon:yes gene_type:complete
MENNNQTDLEEVIQEVEQEETTTEETVEQDLSKFESADDPDVIKVDLNQPVEQVNDSETNTEEATEEVAQEENVNEEVPTLEEVTDEENTEEQVVTKEEVMEALDEAEETGKQLPENIQKLVDFMEDTGGSLEDYVRLNRDTSKLDDQQALREYYERTKPHLSSDEINFLIEDRFSFDEDMDDDRDIKRKKLAFKEQVAEAKTYLDGQKSKYYEEIKAGSKLTPEQQKAMDFFNRYNKETEQVQRVSKKQKDVFDKNTAKLFNDKFKGFEYNVGEKVYRFNIKDAGSVQETQSDINNFVKKFLDENNTMKDAKGYHKGLYTAMNADAIAQHFYEQGKADAIKDNVKRSKNIDMDPRGSHNETEVGGIKVRALGDDSASFKFKIKK